MYLQVGPNRYRPFTYRSGNIARHTNDHLCRQIGDVPDFTDPEICPQLWPLSQCPARRPARLAVRVTAFEG